ncbi:DUF1127 domain-containing protein [Terasakiella pusilla]|uniref:DUF1127 domain-containing protein n=1 Tax=Terasakiella pusilla TaxID=64973 RepID=UPI003AA8E94B
MRQECIDTIDTQTAPQLSWGQWAKTGARMVKADVLQLVTLLWTWHERSRQRFKMRQMSDDILKDIGRSRADIEKEAQKPFWKA